MTWVSDWNGYIPTQAQHEVAARATRRRLEDITPLEASPSFELEYDDGNGLWITSGETPIYQGFFRKYHPQGYTPREA